MSENAKSDLNKYKNLNLISPKIFTGPSDEILQKKISFQNHSFGSQTETINIDIINGWIRNMTLRIELDALTTEEIKTSKNPRKQPTQKHHQIKNFKNFKNFKNDKK